MADPPPNAPASIAGIAAHKAPNNSFWGGLNTHRPPPAPADPPPGPPPAPTSAAAAVPLRCPLLPPPPPTTPPASGGTEGETGGPMAAPRGPILPHPPPQTPRRVIPPPSPPPPPATHLSPRHGCAVQHCCGGQMLPGPPSPPPGSTTVPLAVPGCGGLRWGAPLGAHRPPGPHIGLCRRGDPRSLQSAPQEVGASGGRGGSGQPSGGSGFGAGFSAAPPGPPFAVSSFGPAAASWRGGAFGAAREGHLRHGCVQFGEQHLRLQDVGAAGGHGDMETPNSSEQGESPGPRPQIAPHQWGHPQRAHRRDPEGPREPRPPKDSSHEDPPPHTNVSHLPGDPPTSPKHPPSDGHCNENSPPPRDPNALRSHTPISPQ